MVALSAGVDDTGQQGEGAGAVADAASDHPVAQRPLGEVVGQRQVRMLEERSSGSGVRSLARRGPAATAGSVEEFEQGQALDADVGLLRGLQNQLLGLEARGRLGIVQVLDGGQGLCGSHLEGFVCQRLTLDQV